jgi:hypothetical protein
MTEVAPAMRICLSIVSILILLTLCAELVSVRGYGNQTGSACPACIVDDDGTETGEAVQRENLATKYYFWDIAGLMPAAQSAKTSLLLSVQGAEIVQISSGIRRHRQLCRECC